MLQLKSIVKDYPSGDETVHALKGIDISFRESEFVSILGQSGCGKTTLLNIIGGLDRYTSGDLIINGRSTKEYKDRDWDTYRNHTIGFVFQSYNLIPHQNVLSNVELALTLSGVSKTERRRRAREALEKVGLGDQLKKMPNQLSGGQMQRVAIARALVNDPDILLADEPTGALDSETSVQVMELLKEISRDRLVIMVTHNPELADAYSTRIVRLLDGEIISDSMPFDPEAEMENPQQVQGKKPSMSFRTAFGLSLKNLMTKKGRTILTAFAGSIGIIGIALILSLSNGVQKYIDDMEEDTLTSYPITIQQATMDMTSMMSSMQGLRNKEEHAPGQLYSSSIMINMLDSVLGEISSNDLKSFKKELETPGNEIAALASEIRYSYPTQVGIYTTNVRGEVQRVNPVSVLEDIGLGDIAESMGVNNIGICTELSDNQSSREADYELITGAWPENTHEVVMIVSGNDEITDYTLYSLGLLDTEELRSALSEAMSGMSQEGGEVEIQLPEHHETYSYEDILGLELKLVLPTDYYQAYDGVYEDMRDDGKYMKELVAGAETLKVVGIVRSTAETGNEYGRIGYTAGLTEYVVNAVNESEVVKAQKADPDTDVFTGLPFAGTEAAQAIEAAEETAAAGETEGGYNEAQRQLIGETVASLPEMYQTQLADLSEEEQAGLLMENGLLTQENLDALGDPGTETARPEKKISDSSYEQNLNLLYAASLEEPSSISIYAASFEDKEDLTDALDAYNDRQTHEDKVIHYTDYVGLLMSSVTDIVNIVSYVLIAFVGISLIVSSIMIGVITLISVQERTKEIGILRSIGASRKDISRVFNAETLIIGLAAGLVGVGVAALADIPINIIIDHLAGINDIAQLPLAGAVILVLISVLLTVLAGLIPSRAAARKNPVEALRTE